VEKLEMKRLFFLILIGLCNVGMSDEIKGNRCYLLTGYVFDISYPFAYVLSNEMVIINNDTIFTDIYGRYQFLIYYYYPKDIKIGFPRLNLSENDISIFISVRNKKAILKSPWKKMEKKRKQGELPVENFNILVERLDTNYKIMNEIK
jgi:hypothetical protein